LLAPIYLPPPPNSEARPLPIPLWLVAAVLAGLALVAAQIPFGRIPAIVLSLVGLGVGGFSALIEGRLARWSVVASVLNGLIFFVTLFLPSWLGLEPFRGGREEVYLGAMFIEFNTSRAKAGLNKPRPLSDGEWIESDRGGWQQDDARVYVSSVVIGPVELDTSKGKIFSKDKSLRIGLNLTNIGVSRAIQYRPFDEPGRPGEPSLSLKDAEDRTISLRSFHAGQSVVGKEKAKPVVYRTSIDDVLVFELPPGRWEFLLLELPATSVGQTGVIRFRILNPKDRLGKDMMKGFFPN